MALKFRLLSRSLLLISLLVYFVDSRPTPDEDDDEGDEAQAAPAEEEAPASDDEDSGSPPTPAVKPPSDGGKKGPSSGDANANARGISGKVQSNAIARGGKQSQLKPFRTIEPSTCGVGFPVVTLQSPLGAKISGNARANSINGTSASAMSLAKGQGAATSNADTYGTDGATSGSLTKGEGTAKSTSISRGAGDSKSNSLRAGAGVRRVAAWEFPVEHQPQMQWLLKLELPRVTLSPWKVELPRVPPSQRVKNINTVIFNIWNELKHGLMILGTGKAQSNSLSEGGNSKSLATAKGGGDAISNSAASKGSGDSHSIASAKGAGASLSNSVVRKGDGSSRADAIAEEGDSVANAITDDGDDDSVNVEKDIQDALVDSDEHNMTKCIVIIGVHAHNVVHMLKIC
ncbi:hypothetical protein Ocin01_15705 [Orchesella cincta]|uniref:Uncharacterized protein n=1 Tax=Orchesella cincta TaxID=48709 RepID=A0A1D2MD90_ORCCI|nr:hypothetical protein Ocin01_15705 [Orchesella cincta]